MRGPVAGGGPELRSFARRRLLNTVRLGTVRLGAVGTVLVTAMALSACSAAPAISHRTTTTSSTAPGTTTTQPASAPANTGAWTTYGGSFARTSVDSADPSRTSAPTEAWKSVSLDGDVYGEPLVFGGNVYVGTENDTVYAFSESTGDRVWGPDHLATPAPSGDLPCGDISPSVGITSTMVVDPSNDDLFASAETSSGGTVGHHVFAIDARSGKVLWNRDVDQSWDAAAQLQRAALALDDGNVLVGFGGNYGDCGNYGGWVIGVPESGSGALLHYRVPTQNEGAVWAPAGISVDPTGDAYVATGNGSAGPGRSFDHGNSVIRLSPQLKELGYFAPTGWAQDSATDLDLGSSAPMLLGNGQIFQIGKPGVAYLLDSSNLGGIGGQSASLGLCFSSGGGAYVAPYAYVVCLDQGRIAQVQVGPGNSLRAGWRWASPSGTASSPTVAGGFVWSIDQSSSTLYGVRLTNGSTAYSVHLSVGALAHFVAPSAAGGMLFVAGAGGVEAFR
jgi:hypothetical protein